VQRWLWVTLPDTYSGLTMRPGDPAVWSCAEDSRPGDIALLYRADVMRDFSHVFRIESDPYDDARITAQYGDVPACDCKLIARLGDPITLAAVRAVPALANWRALLVGFHGTAFPIEPTEWRSLVGLTSPRDRSRMRAVGGG
jgi:predicted RNA-binding protein with PUA-like domain